jgi:hypothetical protein
LIKDPNFKAYLIYIKSNFEIIQSTIKILESKDYLLSEAMIKINNAKTTLKKIKKHNWWYYKCQTFYIYNIFHIFVHHFKQHFK